MSRMYYAYVLWVYNNNYINQLGKDIDFTLVELLRVMADRNWEREREQERERPCYQYELTIYIYIYIYIYIIIIMSCHQHGYPWPCLATSPYHSSLLAGLQGYIPCPHIAAVCMLGLVVLLLLGHMRGSIGVHHWWVCPCFSRSVLRVWFV